MGELAEYYEIDDSWDEHMYFLECTCEHGSEQHGWQKCELCDCQGHWEE